MTADGLDTLIKNAFPATRIPPDQVQRVMAGVFARLDQPQPQVRLGRWQRLGQLLSELTPAPWVLVRQAAVPVALALVLGVYLGQTPSQTTPQIQLLASLTSPLMSAGY